MVRHWYTITGCVKFMAKLQSFTSWVEAEARWESSCLSIQKTQLPAVSDTLRSIRSQDPDHEFPLCKTRRAVSPVVLEVSAVTTSTVVSSVTLYAGAVASSVLVATQPYPSSPESRASTVCVDLDAFAFEGSGSSDRYVLVSPVEKDRVNVSLVNSGDDEQTDMAVELSRFQPLI